MVRNLMAAAVGVGLFIALQTPARSAVKAFDVASNAAYAFEADGAWKGTYPNVPPDDPPAGQNPPGDDNGGSGFLPWTFGGGYHQDGGPYGVLNHFIDGVDFPTTPFNNLGAPAFGLGNVNLPFFGITATASRQFAQTMAVGDTFTPISTRPPNTTTTTTTSAAAVFPSPASRSPTMRATARLASRPAIRTLTANFPGGSPTPRAPTKTTARRPAAPRSLPPQPATARPSASKSLPLRRLASRSTECNST